MEDSEQYTAGMAALRDRGPHAGSRWRHAKTGNVYVIVFNGLLESTCEPHVGYRREDGTPPVWFRPLAEFLDGRFVQIKGPPRPTVGTMLRDQFHDAC